MERNIECVSWTIYWHDYKLTLFNLMSQEIEFSIDEGPYST